MDKTLEARLFGRDNMVLDEWYYFCAYVVSVMLCACSVVYILFMQCYLQGGIDSVV